MTLPYDINDPKSIEAYSKKLIGKTLREVADILPKNINKINKGNLGQLLEEFYFYYSPNNDKEPDFPEAGLELKSTPLKKLKNGRMNAKERLSLNTIDFMEEYKKGWETSSFWKKNKRLLLIFYLYKKDLSVIDRKIKMAGIWDYPDEDLKIIRDDYQKIIDKIKSGEAHKISEGDTLYLGASTKGAGGGRDNRKQPFSNLPAKQRAFSLKRNYMDFVIDRWPDNKKRIDAEPIVKNPEAYQSGETFEEYIIRQFNPYIGKSVNEIHDLYGISINPKAKNYFSIISKRILGVKSQKIEEFEKANITLKTIRLNSSTNKPKEDISFPYFRYKEIIEEKWDSSTFRERLDKKFFFVIFKYNDKKDLILKKVTFWNIPYDDLEIEVKRVWKETKKRILDKNANNLPKMSESPVCHVRPHARDSKDTNETHYGENLVKKSFWLNRSYVYEQITKDIN
jgi:DNA mismatch repair protein MutH